MRNCFFFLVVLFVASSVFTQNKVKKKNLLKTVLTNIESKHNVKFSYAEETINNKYFELPINGENLEDLLQSIEKEVGVYINKINERYYSIVKYTSKKINICGYIKDSLTNYSLEQATIVLKNKQSIGTTTDSNGFFKLKKIRINDTLQVSFAGYKTILMLGNDFYKKKCLEVKLKEKLNVLDEVIIANYLSTNTIKNDDGSIVMRPKKRGVLPGLTESDVLLSTQQIPGIQSPVETAAGIHIRGGTPDQNLILFDGIKLYNTAHFFGSISAFNPNIIDKVTVYKNASNIKYGNHIAGVISMNSMDEVPQKQSTGFGVNMTAIDAFTTIPLTKKIGIQLSIRSSLSDFLKTPTMNNISTKVFQNTSISKGNLLAEQPYVEAKNDFSFLDMNTKFLYQLNEKNKITLQQILIHNSLDYSLQNFKINDIRSDKLKIKNYGFGATWDSKWNTSWKHNLNVYHAKYTLGYQREKNRAKTIYDYTNKDNTVNELSFDFLITKELNKKSSFLIGYQYAFSNIFFNLEKKNTVVFSESKNKNDGSINSHSILTGYKYKNKDFFIVDMGVRTTYLSSLNKVVAEPRLYTQLKIAPNFWLNASAELKQQYTSKIVEFFTSDFGLENKLWALSDNEEIPLLQSKQFTFGSIFKYKKWVVDFGMYYKSINGITSLSSGFNNYSKTVFNGSALIRGFDLLVRKKWSNRLNTWFSYNLGNTALTFDGFNSNQSFNGGFNISNSLYIAQQIKLSSWDLSLGWTYKAGLPFSSLINLNPNNGLEIEKYNNSNLPAYHRLDASATYNFFWDKKNKIISKVGISFLNIYNRKNILKRTSEVSYDDAFKATLNTIDTYSLSFTPNIIFRVEF